MKGEQMKSLESVVGGGSGHGGGGPSENTYK